MHVFALVIKRQSVKKHTIKSEKRLLWQPQAVPRAKTSTKKRQLLHVEGTAHLFALVRGQSNLLEGRAVVLEDRIAKYANANTY